VLATARAMFLREGRLDMRALAKDLGIGRATLYRKVSDREDLLGDVFLSLGLANFRHAQADTKTPPGPERICDVTDLNLERIRSNKSFERFLREEPEVAARVLLDARGKVYLGWLVAWADFVRRVEQASGWKAPLGPDALSQVMMRVSNAFIFADVYAHDKPDTTTPGTVLRLMLGVLERTRGGGRSPRSTGAIRAPRSRRAR
jgi:AcrR family transcriptional regulator